MISSEPETYRVVVNLEEQYSIWPSGRDLPEGWTEVGVQGSKDDCLDHIERVWTDLRPLSLRRALASDA
ncbi:MbtH family protein [Streptomyces sp. NPDC001393]